MKIAWAGTADGTRRRIASMRGRMACRMIMDLFTKIK
jgi:hypothetical protein